MSQESSGWERQKTTKLYVHPPKSERMVTLWPDFKIVNSVRGAAVTQGTEARGFILLTGKCRTALPWQETEFELREDGVPIHVMRQGGTALSYKLESFCSMNRCPDIYSRLTIRNNQPHRISSQISLLPRTGPETLMMGINRDGYCSYRPTLGAWGMIEPTWSMRENTITDGSWSLVLQAGEQVERQWKQEEAGDALHHRYRCDIEFEIEAGQALEIDIAMVAGAGGAFDYTAERSRTEAAWKAEHAGITNTPEFGETGYEAMFNHLVTQMLQLIVSHEGEDYTAIAQGGIERGIWPTEAVELLLGLDKIGLHQHSEPVYRYFKDSQIRGNENEGRIPPLMAPDWACNTGATLWGLSQHLVLRDDAKLFNEFRGMMLLAWRWIERTRQKTLDASFEGIGRGIFPPMSATDWGGEAQSWCWTDVWNVMGLEKLAQAMEQFDDPATRDVRTSYLDYKGIMEQILDDIVQSNELTDEILITNQLGIPASDPPSGPYFCDGPANLIRSGIIRADSKVFEQVETYFRNRKLMRNGLCGLMTDGLLVNGYAADPWAGHTWYTTLPEISWFYAWLERGEFAKAEETFIALTRYGMSKEYRLSERYADNDPTFTPWQPNGSGSGRMVAMLFDYCALKSGRDDREAVPAAHAELAEALA